MPKKMTPQERIAKWVDAGGAGCWEWKGVIDRSGYGLFCLKVDGKITSLRAHRYVYTHMAAPIPVGLIVMHRCDNRKCCNPDHLVVGTAHDNMRDMVAKGRYRRPTTMNKLTPEDVAEIRSYRPSRRGDMQELARRYGITPGHLCKIRRKYAWASV